VSIAHVALEVRREDVPACERFWALLGFEPVAAPEALAERTAWVQREGRQIHLLFMDEPDVPAAGHVAVVCPGYEATLAALRAAGFDPEPRGEYWGSPRCYVRCPAGHRVEVMRNMPAGPVAR
jgi:catechol 2,3-dioxygenase-like lactoylglutathione lyase family enzyme